MKRKSTTMRILSRSPFPLYALLACGCSAVATSQATAPPDVQPPKVSTPPPLASASSAPDSVEDARNMSILALSRCDRVVLAIPTQQLAVKKSAYNRKQGGLLVTAAVGVAGSILTTVLANTQKDSGGSADPQPATIVGASTAGATTVAGVVSLFVVGVGADDRLQQMENTRTQIENRIETYTTDCGDISTDRAAVCKTQARLLRSFCDSASLTLPYSVP